MKAFDTLFDWLAERLRDAAQWPILWWRFLPRRLAWLAGALGEWRRPMTALHLFFAALFDVIGGPEIAQFFMHLVMPTTPLTGAEIAAVSSVLGPTAVRYGDVRIAEGGLLNLIFRYNGGRAFATWHTVHMPKAGRHTRENIGLLVHEVTHVYQYERIGSRYLGEAVNVQRRLGPACYDYGQATGLQNACDHGHLYCEFNREQQAQIAQHYYDRRAAGADVSAYEPFIAELREGAF